MSHPAVEPLALANPNQTSRDRGPDGVQSHRGHDVTYRLSGMLMQLNDLFLNVKIFKIETKIYAFTGLVFFYNI